MWPEVGCCVATLGWVVGVGMGLRGPMPKTVGLHIDEEQDAPILDAFASWVGIQERAIAEVEAAGRLVSETPNGHTQKIPQLNVLADATKMVIALAQQLGRTPAARVRLGADSEQELSDDELDLPELPKRGKRASVHG